MSFNHPGSPERPPERRVSAFGIQGLEQHPLINGLPKARKKIILEHAARADVDGDGFLDRNEYVRSREYCFVLWKALLFTMILFYNTHPPAPPLSQ